MAKGVERVIVLRQREGGRVEPHLVYKATKRKRKQQSSSLRWLEGATHDAADMASTGANTYLILHKRSNRQKPDGWLRDLPDNLWTAAMEGKRRLRFWW